MSLESYIDVGFFGPAIYGVVFGIVFFLCDSLIAFAALRHQMMAVLSSGVLMRSIFGPEANPITYFSELRSVAIYVILAMLLAAAFGRKSIQQAGERGASKDHASQHPSRMQAGPRLVPPGLPAH